MSDFTNRMASLSNESTRFMQDLGYKVEQKNGQRHSKFIGSWSQNEKDNNNNNNNHYGHKECEVFIGKIPRDMFEKELYPHLSRAGRVVHLRIMMDFSGTTRGFGFAKYSTPQEAKNAVMLLNNTIVREGFPTIGVIESFDNKRLYFGNLPPNVNEELLLRELESLLEGVVGVELPECSTLQESRYAFVQFRTHDDATQARRILVPGDVKMFDRSIRVDWAKPEKSSSNNSSINENTFPINYNNNNNNNNQRIFDLASPTLSSASSSTTSASINYDYQQQISLNQSIGDFTAQYQQSMSKPAATFVTDILGEKTKQMLMNCPKTPTATTTSAPPQHQPSWHELLQFAENQVQQQSQQILPGTSNVTPLINLPTSFTKYKQTITVAHLHVMYNLLYSFWVQNNL